MKQGNPVARDLPPTGSEANTTPHAWIKNQNKGMDDILEVDSHCPYLLSGETTFNLTSIYPLFPYSDFVSQMYEWFFLFFFLGGGYVFLAFYAISNISRNNKSGN